MSAWAKFLEARLALIAEWTDEGRTVKRIVADLCVDPVQVQLLQRTIDDRRRTGVSPALTCEDVGCPCVPKGCGR